MTRMSAIGLISLSASLASLLGGGVAVWRWVTGRRRGPEFRSPSIDELRPGAKILVVDDKHFEWTTLLRDSGGYEVTKRQDVSPALLADITKSRYDVVLLDLHGIGGALGAGVEQGLGILRQIKEGNPAQIVVGYSAAAWSVGHSNSLRELADATFDKASGSFSEFQVTLDHQLLKSRQLHYYVSTLLGLNPSCSEQDVRRLLACAIARPDGRCTAELESLLAPDGSSTPARPKVQAVLHTARRCLTPMLQ